MSTHTFEGIENNTEMLEGIFDIPEEIKAIMKKYEKDLSQQKRYFA